MTGVAIVEKRERDIWLINTFLLSCRIIGRNVEDTLLAYIVNEAKKDGILLLRGEFIPSKRNKPAKNFYKKSGFKKIQNGGLSELWEFDLTNDFPFPDFIKVKIN